MTTVVTDEISLNGTEMPKRIWLMTYRHAGDVCWTSDPNPEDADEIETVEYIRADQVSTASPPKGLRIEPAAPVKLEDEHGIYGASPQTDNQVERAEHIARLFHDAYERLAPQFSYETRKASAKPWEEVPENNRKLMIATVGEVLHALSTLPPKGQPEEQRRDVGGLRDSHGRRAARLDEAYELIAASRPDSNVTEDWAAHIEMALFSELVKRGIDQDTADQATQAIFSAIRSLPLPDEGLRPLEPLFSKLRSIEQLARSAGQPFLADLIAETVTEHAGGCAVPEALSYSDKLGGPQ